MENKNLKLGTIILTIVFTSIVVGSGVFFLQQNSIKELREEIQNLDLITAEEPNEESIERPSDIEWLTYSDDDIIFTYPKTFLGTSMQEDFDKNFGRDQWEVLREKDVIYIKPNFESPAAEFGATYEINIFKDTWSAEEGWLIAGQLHQGPESQWGEKLTTKAKDFYVGVLRNLDFGLGQIANVYTLVPGGINDLGKSQKPTEKHFMIYAYPDLYSSYIEEILIPSIQAK